MFFFYCVFIWHILSITLEAGRGISAETIGLDDLFLPDYLVSGSYTPIIIYIPYIIATLNNVSI